MKRNHLPAEFWKNPIHLLACGGGAGAAPYAPGTFGTAVAILVWLPLQSLALPWYAVVVAALFLFGVWICGVTARDFGVHDHSGIVWDEIVGYLITMTALPLQWPWIVLGFVAFRIFDILKPWPIRWLDQHVQGGLGIMVDDVLAGIYALVCMQLIYRLL